MPLSGALFASVGGLDAMSTAISVIGDNIANVNTTGFKSRRTEFADVLGQSIATAGGFSQIGAGAKVLEIRSDWTQGTFQPTNRETDVAIEGSGFFILDGPEGRSYTRAGIFSFDSDGYLVSPTGLRVQGYGIDPVTGLSNGELGDIQIAGVMAPPRATTTVTVSANLSAGAATTGAFNPSNPLGTSDLQTVIDVYDSLGIRHPATLYFSKTGSNTWAWTITLAPSHTTTAPANPNDPVVVQGGGTLTFNSDGVLTNATGTNVSFAFSGGATSPQSITIDFGAIGVAGSGGTTQVGDGASTINSFTQDGYAPGSLQSVEIDDYGYLSGTFSNGENIPLAQFALAHFPNVEGLQRVGNNNLIETRTSGQPLIGQPRTGSFGAIRSSNLEQSNVDLATEFVRLIVNQRAFQANTRTISTTNELLGDLVNLGR
ncbi:MAG TPA: flagellar hook protein FlgE [Myxococcota bacterium]